MFVVADSKLSAMGRLPFSILRNLGDMSHSTKACLADTLLVCPRRKERATRLRKKSSPLATQTSSVDILSQ